MNELIKTSQGENGDIIVSGRELHEFLEVKTRYNDWFERMISYGFVENIDFIKVTQKRVTSHGRKHDMKDHHIKLDMAKEISMIQRTEKGKQARQYFLHLEKMWNSPEMVMKRALQYADQKVIELKNELEEKKPLITFAETCMTSEKSLLVREVAKLASKQGVKTGERRLWKKLREWKLVFSDKNEPYQEYVDRGYFEITQGVKEIKKGSFTWLTMRVTPKGQMYIINRLKKEQNERKVI